MRTSNLLSIFLFVLFFTSISSAESLWVIGHGEFDDNDGASNAFLVENRTNKKVLGDIKLYYEILHTTQDAFFIAPGLYYELSLGRKLVLTPCLGAGFYECGDDKNLGLAFQWRSGADISLKLPKEWRIGLMYHHLSNMGFTRPNPGAESYLFFLSKSF